MSVSGTTSKRADLSKAKRFVVKVGSALLIKGGEPLYANLARQIHESCSQKRQAILVTSGAVATGWPLLGFKEKPKDKPAIQAAAAIGQSAVMTNWQKAFEPYGTRTAQILITHSDLSNRERYLNLRSCIETLLSKGILPIVNENDAITTGEIKVGNNDLLAAELCGVAFAEVAIILTSTNGVFSADPLLDPTSERITQIESLDEELIQQAGNAATHGTGGLKTKLEAAKIAREHGAQLVVASGFDLDALGQIFKGEDVGTYVTRTLGDQLPARKRWIATTLRTRGAVLIDAGAFRALQKGASLLPAGVKGVRGEFRAGDAVDIIAQDEERVVARGIVSLSSGEVSVVAGLNSADVSKRFSILKNPELVHRDDMVLL